MATDWFEIKKTTIAEVTATSLWAKFENHVFPKLGHRPIDKILAPEAIEALKPLAAHGLRALASTTLNEQGHDPDVIEAALSHIDKNEVIREYHRAEYLERRRVLMCWWPEHIENAASGKTSIEDNLKHLKVVQMINA